MLRETLHHCESVRKHSNTTGFARIEVKELSFNCLEH
jgi:hypothetical protein